MKFSESNMNMKWQDAPIEDRIQVFENHMTNLKNSGEYAFLEDWEKTFTNADACWTDANFWTIYFTFGRIDENIKPIETEPHYVEQDEMWKNL